MSSKSEHENPGLKIKKLEKKLVDLKQFEKITKTLFSVSNAVNTTVNLDELYLSIHQSLGKIIDVTNFFIALYDRENDILSFPYSVDTEDNLLGSYYEVSNPKDSSSLSVRVIKSGKPLFLDKNEIIRYAKKMGKKILGPAAKVWVGVPLKIKNEVIGAMAVQSYIDPDMYHKKDIEVLLSVSDQVATAIDRKRSEEEAYKRANLSALIHKVSQRVSSKLEMGELLSEISTSVCETFNYETVIVMLYDEYRKVFVLEATEGKNSDVFPKGWTVPVGKGMIGYAAQSGKIQVSGNVSKNKHYLKHSDEIVNSELAIPIKSGDKIIGVFDLQSADFNAFDEIDISSMETLSVQIGIAIENARLFEDVRQGTEKLALVNRLASAIGTTLNLDKLLETIYQEIEKSFKPDAFFIALYSEKDKDELDIIFHTEDGIRYSPGKCALGKGFSAKIVSEKKPLFIRDYEKEKIKLPKPVFLNTKKVASSWIGIPLIVGQRITGIINFQAWRPYAWDEEEEALFFSIADQVAVAIEKARLYEKVQRELVERKLAEEEKKNLEFQLLQAQKMEAVGTLAGGIAHDFNNLLLGIQGDASVMRLHLSPEHTDYKKLISIEESVKSGAKLTRQLLGFARGGKYEVKATSLNTIIEDAAAMYGRTRKEIRIHSKFQANVWTVNVDQVQIRQVLLNLFVNAGQAMPGGGDLYLSTENVKLNKNKTKIYGVLPGRFVRTTVTDTGHGIDEDIQHRIFEPFFTTKERGAGTGLGLASTYGIVKNHDGFLDVISKKGEGATFTFYLPATHAPVIEKPPPELEAAMGNETILVIDDETRILEVSKSMLEELGYKVMTADKGIYAITIFGQRRKQVNLVVLDLVMPEINSKEIFDKIKSLEPEIKVLLASGYSVEGADNEYLLKESNGFIQKPYDIIQFSTKIRKILDQS